MTACFPQNFIRFQGAALKPFAIMKVGIKGYETERRCHVAFVVKDREVRSSGLPGLDSLVEGGGLGLFVIAGAGIIVVVVLARQRAANR